MRRTSLATLGFAAILVAGLLQPGSASAQGKDSKDRSEILTTLTPERMSAILKEAGYRAEIQRREKNPRVLTGIGGRDVLVVFYDCDTGCTAFQFYAEFSKAPKYTLAFINKWNTSKRYGKAYLDKDNDVAFEFDDSAAKNYATPS